MTSFSISPCELEEHLHTFPILYSSGGSESLALGPLHTHAAVGDTQCSRGGGGGGPGRTTLALLAAQGCPYPITNWVWKEAPACHRPLGATPRRLQGLPRPS